MVDNTMALHEVAFKDPLIKALIENPEAKVDAVVTLPIMCEPIYYMAYK